MPKGLVWLNGEFLDFESAKVSVEDRGFQFADGVYEVIRVYHGTPFLAEAHLTRLHRSASGIELPFPLSNEEFQSVMKELLQRSELTEAEIYIQITRGVMPRDHKFPEKVHPTVVMTIRPPRAVSAEIRASGAKAITVPDERWGRCDIKSIALIANILARQKAHRSGAYEAIFIRQGYITEATSSNVFLYDGSALLTPTADHRILNGITRQYLIHLAKNLGYTIKEQDIPQDALFTASEVLLTGTITEVLPLVEIDGQKVGDGAPGEVYKKLYSAFRSSLPY